MTIRDFLSPRAVLSDLAGSSAEEVVMELGGVLSATTGVPIERLAEALLARERLGSTGIGDGVALPHAKLDGLPGLVAAFGRSRRGVEFKAVDGRPATLFFALLSPTGRHGDHLNALVRISRVFKSVAFRAALLGARNSAELYRLITDEDGK